MDTVRLIKCPYTQKDEAEWRSAVKTRRRPGEGQVGTDLVLASRRGKKKKRAATREEDETNDRSGKDGKE
jgi:hypothetical protein